MHGLNEFIILDLSPIPIGSKVRVFRQL